MKVLFDIGHPAHVHLFRNLIIYLINDGNKVTVVSRDKEVTNALLEHYGIDFQCISKPSISKIGMAIELIRRDAYIFNLHRKIGFDLAIGTSVSIAHLTALTGVPSYNFNEDDDDVVPLYTRITYPFTTKIIHPKCIRTKGWEEKRIRYASYHELAYLHPNQFTLDTAVLNEYGLRPKDYILIRQSALAAHHDKGAKGLGLEMLDFIGGQANKYSILKSHELKKANIKPWHMHQILAGAAFLFSDSQTMSMEAAVLGVPSVRLNSFARKCSVLDELEFEYGLTYAFHPDTDIDSCKHKITELLSMESTCLQNEWQEKRQKLLNEKVDFLQWQKDFVTNQKWVQNEL